MRLRIRPEDILIVGRNLLLRFWILGKKRERQDGCKCDVAKHLRRQHRNARHDNTKFLLGTHGLTTFIRKNRWSLCDTVNVRVVLAELAVALRTSVQPARSVEDWMVYDF